MFQSFPLHLHSPTNLMLPSIFRLAMIFCSSSSGVSPSRLSNAATGKRGKDRAIEGRERRRRERVKRRERKEGRVEELGEGTWEGREGLCAYQRWLAFCFQILPDTYEVVVCEITAHKRSRHTSHILSQYVTSLSAGSAHCVLTTCFLQVSSKVV